jgi:HEPN domain-containing protein
VKSVTALWLKRAEHDLRAAELTLEDGMPELCVFHCQQALEKLLKAILMERSPQDRARRTHDLVWLAREVVPDIELAEMEFLRELAEEYVVSRYGDDDVDSNKDLFEYLRHSLEFFSWLHQLLS